MQRTKTIFHVHTHYSDDSNTSPADLIRTARQRGVGCVTVTDHDEIEGARECSDRAGDDLAIIIGEEVSTAQGHLIGLFLREFVEPGMSARDTAKAIREQGGLVVVPHPFNTMFGCSLRDAVYDLIDWIDIVEVCNSQNLLPGPNRRAEAFADRFAFLKVVGADVHHQGYLDSCYQYLAPFSGPTGFLESLHTATFVRGRHSLSYFLRSACVIARGRLGLEPLPGYGARCKRTRHEPVAQDSREPMPHSA